MNLYDLTQEAKALEDLILDATTETGELPENVQEIIEAWSTQVGGSLEGKLEAIGRLVRNWDADADGLKAEIDRLAAKKKAVDNRVKRTKEWTKICLEMAGITKQTAGVFAFAIQKNGGKRPLEMAPDLDAATLPLEFQRVEISANTEAIRTALDGGTELPFARLLESGTHLRIR